MNEMTCLIIGGGHAGVAALHFIRASTRKMVNNQRIRFVLIDQQPAHVRKVMLFRSAVSDEEITVPWSYYISDGAEFIQGTVTYVNGREKRVQYVDQEGKDVEIRYDLLVIAIGSIVRKPDADLGGMVLSNLESARNIRMRWRENLRKAAKEKDAGIRQSLMSVAVAGAGISGMETSAELARSMRKEAKEFGLNPDEVRIYLLNAQDRLFIEGPSRLGRKLEQHLSACGVTVLHNRKALQEKAGTVLLDEGEKLNVGLCIWTIGLIPNPVLRQLGVPLTEDGRIVVDESYRIQGFAGAYSIGDCAKVIDPKTNQEDQMTCKEGGMQAYRLGKIIKADLAGRPAPIHQSMIELFAIGLGENRGLVWVRKWGINLIITGKMAWKMKKIAWNGASMLR